MVDVLASVSGSGAAVQRSVQRWVVAVAFSGFAPSTGSIIPSLVGSLR